MPLCPLQGWQFRGWKHGLWAYSHQLGASNTPGVGRVAMYVVGVSPSLGPVTLADEIGLCAVAWTGIYTEISQLSSRGMGPLVSPRQVCLSAESAVPFSTLCLPCPPCRHNQKDGIMCSLGFQANSRAGQMQTGPGRAQLQLRRH